MKRKLPIKKQGRATPGNGGVRRGAALKRGLLLRRCLLAALVSAGCWSARGAEGTNSLSPTEMFEGKPGTGNNWVELSTGGLITSGNTAQAEQILQQKRGASGGIQDLHLGGAVSTNLNLTLDGHSLFDQHDYDLTLRLERPEKWYLQVNAQNFLTWYNADGGFYPPTGVQYSNPGGATAVERGQISFEGGLNLKEDSAITFKYTHWYRDDANNSTIWGPAHVDPGNPALIRGVSPSIYSLDESSDSFSLDVTRRIMSTDVGLGLRYEHGRVNDSGDLTFFPGEPVQRDVTSKTGTSYDLLSVHAFTETWINPKLFFSSGFLFENQDSTFSGSRIYGDDFDVGYTPNFLNGRGFYNLTGDGNQQDYVMNLNLLSTPAKAFTITPSIRVQQEYWNTDSSGIGTLGTASQPFNAEGDRSALDVTGGLEARYTGFTNWVLHAKGEWNDGDGKLTQNGGTGQINGIGIPPIQQETEDSRLFQKYSGGVTWYPLRRLVVDVGGYVKHNSYNYNNTVDSTPNDPTSVNRYPAYLVLQDFTTYDGNLRLTVKPLQNLTLVARYEYQLSTVDTRPDSISGLSQVESSEMTTHIFGGSVTWIPWNRLSLQLGLDDVLSNTRTPVSDSTTATLDAANGAGYTQAILNSRNNYWTANFSSGFVLDDKTDLNLNYFFYDSDNTQNDPAIVLPLDAASREHGVLATLTRRITKNLRMNLRYGYYNFHDLTSGGHNDFEAHLIYTSLQYRF